MSNPDGGNLATDIQFVEFIALASGHGVFRELDMHAEVVPEPASLAPAAAAASGLGLLARGCRRTVPEPG